MTDRVRGGAVTVLFATALLATGCGGDEGKAGAAPTPSASRGDRAAYIECLRKNGAPPPGEAGDAGADPSAEPGEEGEKGKAASPELRKARQACRSLAPGRDPARAAARKAFRACLKEQGVELPGKDGKKKDEADGAEKSRDPKIVEAIKKCRSLRNGKQPASPGGQPPASPGG